MVPSTLVSASQALQPPALTWRNRSERPWVWPRHFGSAGAVLVLVMFVAVSSAWNLAALGATLGIAVALVLTRAAAKSLAVLTLARPSGLGIGQAMCLGVALLPDASLIMFCGAGRGWYDPRSLQ